MSYSDKSLFCLNKAVFFLSLFFLLRGTVHATQPPAKQLQYGEQVQGELQTNGAVQWWTFEGEAGDIILLDMRVAPNTRLDPYLQLLSPNGRTLAENDDSNNTLNAHIGPYQLPAKGVYQIVAGQRAGIGTYQLHLTSTEQLPAINLDKALSVVLTDSQPLQYFRLENITEPILRIIMESQGQNPVLPLLFLTQADGQTVDSYAAVSAGVIDPFLSQANTLYILTAEIPFPKLTSSIPIA